MNELTPEDRDFLQALTGQRPGNAAELALREDLLALGRLQREIAEDDGLLTPGQEARRERVMARLGAANVGASAAAAPPLAATPAPAAGSSRQAARPGPSLAARLLGAFWGDDWLRPVAFASVLGFGLLIGKQLTPPQEDMHAGAERRVDTPAELTLIATDAAAEAKALADRLTKEGVQAQAVQIGLQPPRWTIRVTAESDADQAKARQILLGDALAKRQLRVDVIQANKAASAPAAASR